MKLGIVLTVIGASVVLVAIYRVITSLRTSDTSGILIGVILWFIFDIALYVGMRRIKKASEKRKA